MDEQLNIDPANVSDSLSEDDKQLLVKFVLECDRRGRVDRKRYELDWKECDRLYNCEPKPIEDDELDWQSNIVLPWAYDSAESWNAYLHSTMIPKRDEIFTLTPRTDDDAQGAKAMQDYLVYKLDKAHFSDFFGRCLRQLSRQNHLAVKRYWKVDKRTEHAWQPVDEPTPDGSYKTVRRKITSEQVTYNGLAFDIIPLEDFSFWPIYGDFEKTTRIHTTYRFIEDLISDTENGIAPYDLDTLRKHAKECAENDNALPEGAEKDCKRKFQGVKIQEAWIHRFRTPDGTVYKNYILTLMDKKTVIGWRKAPAGPSPFHWLALRPDADCLYGYGLNSKGIGILNSACELHNMKMDEIQLRIHPPTKWFNDGIFNPFSVVNRPGAFVETAPDAIGNQCIPIMQDFTGVNLGDMEIDRLKVEFETVTVPKVVKGMIEVQRASTATEQNLAQNNASGKMHADAYHINENFLKPFIEADYAMLYERLNVDESLKQEMASITVDGTEVIETADSGQPLPAPVVVQKSPQQLIEELPKILPLPDVDIQVVGYQNQIRRQEQQIAAQSLIAMLADSPAAMFLKWGDIAETGAELADLDKDRIVMSAEERKQVQEDQQKAEEQKTQLLIAQEKAKLDLQAQKQQQDYEIKQADLALKKREMELQFELDMERLILEGEKQVHAVTNQETGRGASPAQPKAQGAQ